MTMLHTGWKLAALAILAWPSMDTAALAQRGDRGGGGDRSGARSDGGERGGGNRGDGGRGRSLSGGGQRGGGQRSAGQPGGREFNRSGSQRVQGVPQRSFYRGPGQADGDRTFSGRDLDYNRNSGRDEINRGTINREGGRAFDSDRAVTRDFEYRARDFQNRDLDGDRRDFDRDRDQFTRDRDRDDQFARDRNRDRDRSDSDRNRGDRDRDSWDRSNWDRDDWNRFGRGVDGWGWGGDDIRRSWWRYSNRGNLPFRYGWWDSYYGAGWPIYSPYRYSRWQNQPYYWWSWTPAARLGSALVFGWDRPRYWAYGPGENIYYQDNYVYYDDRRTIPISDYYQQVYDLAHSVPNISESEAERMEWNPLGVFAVHRPNESESSRAMQLAVSNDGVITGTYFNRDSDQVHPLSGMVDERTQRAAWAFADGQQEALVFETGIYNLTRNESTMMVHFGPSQRDTEVWQLVRLEQPDDSSGAAPVPTSRRPIP